MECIRLVSIVALGHLIREYNRLQEPLQFPDGGKIKFSEHTYNYYCIFPIAGKRSLTAKFKSVSLEAATQHLEIIN